MGRAAWFLAGVVIAAAGSAAAQYGVNLGQFTGYGPLEWRSGCRKPSWIRGADPDIEYQAYVRCLRSRVENDARYASARVAEEAASELRQVRREGEAAGVRFD